MDSYNQNGPAGAATGAGFDFTRFDARTVYIKPIDSSLVPGLSEVSAGTTVYAVYSANGAPLAVISDRNAAFSVARQHNMEPVSVH